MGKEGAPFPAPPVATTNAATAACQVRGGVGVRPLDAVDQALLAPIVLAGCADASAAPGLVRPGYALAKVSTGGPAGAISQLAFRPGDPAHVYAARTSGVIARYDYDPVTGLMSNALDVAVAPGYTVNGLAFHGSDLFVSLNAPPVSRLARFSDPAGDGVYGTRHDFVYGIPAGAHGVNQIEIVGNTLYVGIGAARRNGDPAEENVYTMTVARIVDLSQVDFSGPISPDFTGPINYLADPVEWVNTSGSDGRLRYYASGFRNPFGIVIDADGDLWLSTNGNSDPGFLSPDLVYKKVPLGGQGDFPPASFGFGPPHITGTPIEPLANLGQSPSLTGLAFMPHGPDAGKLVASPPSPATSSSSIRRPVSSNSSSRASRARPPSSRTRLAACSSPTTTTPPCGSSSTAPPSTSHLQRRALSRRSTPATATGSTARSTSARASPTARAR